jgi:glucosyl-3-phosphoglycerate synthase
MSDFAQSGLISTLQRLNDSHLAQIEAELIELTAARPIALVLPCHGAELDRPALTHMICELGGARWIHRIAISMNGLPPGGLDAARTRFSQLPQPIDFLENERPPGGLAPGKGTNVWLAFQALAARGEARVVATQDCDVASFRRADLARLCYAIAHPALDFRFAKMYYSRVTDRLYGRVSRLFFAPLLHAIVRTTGHQPLVDFLLSFRYPLAGEIALDLDLAASLPPHSGWTVELGHLCDVFRRVDPREVCQVDGGTGYDHKHQPAASALAAMAAEIARELFQQLAAEGMAVDASLRRAVALAYRKEAAHALRRSASLARINALPFDEAAERTIAETFASRLDALADRAS